MLDAGAHECIALGSAVPHLSARLPVRLGEARGRAMGQPSLLIDPAGFRVKVNDTPVNLGMLEFRFLSLLASEPNRVFTFQEVESFVYQTDGSASREGMKQLAYRVRRKLGQLGRRIEAVRGVGFRLAQ